MKKLVIALLLMLLNATTALAAGTTIDYTIGGKPYQGYFVSPGANAPLVLLVHDWDGLTDYEIKRSQMLADLGYAVFAADLFGKGVRPTTLEEKKRLTSQLYKDRKRMRSLLDGALQSAQQQQRHAPHSVAIGYCFGGAAVLELARSGAEMDAFVTFHGGLATPRGEDYSQTKGKLLVLHGSADKAVTMQDFARLAGELEEAGIKHEMVTYSGAPHAFTIFGSPRYREDADRKSWQRLTEFLEELRQQK